MGRPPWPREKHKAFWRQVAAGLSTTDAAAAVGVSRPVAFRWFAASGGVMPPPAVREPAAPSARRRHGRRLSAADREEIAHLKRQDKSLSEIGAAIGTCGGLRYEAIVPYRSPRRSAKSSMPKMASLSRGGSVRRWRTFTFFYARSVRYQAD